MNWGRSLGSECVGNSTDLVYIVVVLLQDAWKSQRSSNTRKETTSLSFNAVSVHEKALVVI